MGTPDDKDELNRLAPRLHGLPKADPFRVPDGFFERFPHEVQAAVVQRTRRNGPAWNWWTRFAVALPIIALLGAAAWWTLRSSEPGQAVAFDPARLTSDPRIMDEWDESELLAFIEESPDATHDLGSVDMNLDEDVLLTYLENENADLIDLIADIE